MKLKAITFHQELRLMGSREVRTMDQSNPKNGYRLTDRTDGGVDVELTNEPGKGRMFQFHASAIAFKEYEPEPTGAMALPLNMKDIGRAKLGKVHLD